MIVIDGSHGEGGGQILRSSLALALVTGRPFTIHSIRAGRKQPGLLHQHLAAVRAAAEIGAAGLTGATLHSGRLTFIPGENRSEAAHPGPDGPECADAAPRGPQRPDAGSSHPGGVPAGDARDSAIRPGDYHFSVGTAGSATLVLQAVLPALLCAPGPSTLRLEGGTHNPWAPPFDFLARAFLPLLCRMGPSVTATLARPGFFPAGGGEFHVAITPAATLTPLDLLDRGDVRTLTATARIARLPRHVAERELQVIGRELGVSAADRIVEDVADSRGPGNVVAIEVRSEHVTEVFTAFGRRGVPAEQVAGEAVTQARRYLSAGVPVGEFLADQLLIPLAVAGGGAFRTLGLSQHARTNMDVIQAFLDVKFVVDEDTPPGCVVRVRG